MKKIINDPLKVVEESLQDCYTPMEIYMKKCRMRAELFRKRGMGKQPLYLVEAAVMNQCSPDWSEKECLPERQWGMFLLLLIHTRSRKRSSGRSGEGRFMSDLELCRRYHEL